MDSMALVLHAGNANKNAFKRLIAADYSGFQVELTENFEMGVSNKTSEFPKTNPIGKVPVLETPDVTCLKADNPLYGSSRMDYAHIEQLIDFASMEVDATISRWLYPRLGYMPYLAVAEESAISCLKRTLRVLNPHLAVNMFLVGHSVTLADIIMTCNLYLGFSLIMLKSFTSEFSHVERYFWTMVNQPNFRKVLGVVKQADSVPFVPSQKKSQTKEVVKPKKVKKERNQEAVEPKVQEVVEEEEEAPKPNPKNPLDLLLPSKMILNEWKRLYSNTKANFRELAIKGFWDMYDPVGYSFWFRDYKYNDENTVSFVTLNKVSGFLQRMDLARKYAFGKMLVTGSDPPFKVKGLWLFHGLEIPKFVLDEVYDMELYDWTKEMEFKCGVHMRFHKQIAHLAGYTNNAYKPKAPVKLQLQFTAFHISEPENNILHNHVILPNNGSLISQAVLPVGNQSFDYGTIWEAREVHFDCLHKWLDIDLGITHLIISAECVLVINLLQDHINSSYNKAQILSQRDDRHGEKGSDRPGRPCA
ncbi:alanine aminotransferase [Musa troglodytarum]|uniref:Alanine aminotransferase n=1 Tax=Musa troglodytarum TaxID=320322 RepID=A0A9E7KXV2_9LILI|nr:alanine aminotransferase [Musa troglodytarum]